MKELYEFYCLIGKERKVEIVMLRKCCRNYVGKVFGNIVHFWVKTTQNSCAQGMATSIYRKDELGQHRNYSNNLHLKSIY